MEYARDYMDVVSKGESSSVKKSPPIEKILKEGNPQHKHALTQLPWNFQEFGSDVTDATEFSVVYWTHFVCNACGREFLSGRRDLL